MEFRCLQNIETAFRHIRLFAIIFVVCSAAITLYSVRTAYAFAEEQRKKIYVLDEGKSLILALAEDVNQNRPVEARDHVKRFHELFFTLSPDKNAIESNIQRSLFLADKTVYNYYKDLAEKGYYNRLISGNMSQVIEIERFECDFDVYPYTVTTHARQIIIRESTITERTLITSCRLINVNRSDNNSHGFMIEDFRVTDNRELRKLDR